PPAAREHASTRMVESSTRSVGPDAMSTTMGPATDAHPRREASPSRAAGASARCHVLADQPAAGTLRSRVLADQPAAGTLRSRVLADQPAAGTLRSRVLADQPAAGTLRSCTVIAHSFVVSRRSTRTAFGAVLQPVRSAMARSFPNAR